MKTNITTATALPSAVLEPVLGPVGKAFEEVSASFDRFCLAAGIAALGEMMDKDAADACGPRHSRGEGRRGYRWGRTRGKIAFHAGKTEIERAALVRRRASLIAATGGSMSAHAATNATTTIPIVFIAGPDPVGDGLVQNL